MRQWLAARFVSGVVFFVVYVRLKRFFPRYNPGRSKVITHEIKHEPLAFDVRGGPTTADHVSLLKMLPFLVTEFPSLFRDRLT